MNTATVTVLRAKTAKKIMDTVYESDKSASYVATNGLINVKGDIVTAKATCIKDTRFKGDSHWHIQVESTILNPSALESLLSY